MDTNNLEENALRELKEETGYVGKKIIQEIEVPKYYYDPWKSNETVGFRVLFQGKIIIH